MNTDATRAKLVAEHGDFLTFAQRDGLKVDRTSSPGLVSYLDPVTRAAWRAWQARAASQYSTNSVEHPTGDNPFPAAEPGPASQFSVPREIVELMAQLDIEDRHDDSGPGSIHCTGCGESARMLWKDGRRLDREADIAHSTHCPREWAKSALSRAEAAINEPERA